MCGLQDFNFLLTDFNRALTHCSAAVFLSLLQKQTGKISFDFLITNWIEIMTPLKFKTMKNTLLSFGLAGLATVALSFTVIEKNGESQEPQKKRHIKMVKIVDGKKMEIDTVFTNDNVFVWNGDTINPVKHMKKFGPDGPKQMHRFDVNVDNKDGKEKIWIFKHSGEGKGEPMTWEMNSEDMEIITEDIDSLGKKIVVRKKVLGDDKDHMIFLHDGNMKHMPGMPPVPPVPPAPPVPHIKMLRHAGKVIDLNDPNIISYKKKDMSGDREKIEIIRKKSDNQEMNFNFNFDEDMVAPMPRVHIKELKGGKNMKITEKDVKVDGKDGKEIKVEVETEENK